MSENLKKLRPCIDQVPNLALYWQTLAFFAELKNETTKDSNRAQSDRAQKQPQIQMDSPFTVSGCEPSADCEWMGDGYDG